MPLAPPPEPPATPANLFVGDVCGPTSFCGEPSLPVAPAPPPADVIAVSYTHLRAHETDS